MAIEGREDAHIDAKDPKNAKTISEIRRLIGARQQAGVELSELLIKELGVMGSANFATHTTGAGDYDEQPKE